MSTLCHPWTVDHQAPLSMGFSRQECWSESPRSSPEDLPNPEIKLCLLGLQHCRWVHYHKHHLGSPIKNVHIHEIYTHIHAYSIYTGASQVLSSKESACNAGDAGSIPRSGRSFGEGNGNPLQCSCLETCKDGGVWWATAHEVTKSWTRVSTHSHVTHTVYICVYVYIYVCMQYTYTHIISKA